VLKLLGLESGDEVICPAHTYVATAESIILAGGRPVFADIEEHSHQISPAEIERRITPKTRAIVVVHLYGLPVDLSAILKIGEKHNLPIIEDCAQAQGTKVDGKHVGTFGLAGCLSFFPSKNLGAFGDSGAVITADDELAAFCTMYCNHGRTEKFTHEFPAANERMDALQAAILDVKLTALDGWNAKKREAAKVYRETLREVDEVSLPTVPDNCEPAWHLFAIRLKNRDVRDNLRTYLKEQGIATGLHYPLAVTQQPAYLPFVTEEAGGPCPIAEQICATVLSLPMYPHISREQINRVVSLVKSGLA
jgi:dTDP-4-amino-4,6-dideoxygalactose transaminase